MANCIWAKERIIQMKIKKNILFEILTILLVIGVGFFVFVEGSSGTNNNLISSVGSENIQIVKLHVEGGKYILEPDTVKTGFPVRIEADISRMPGCSKSIVMPGFNIRKVVNENDKFIEFTPEKAGTFNIACSMNMYKGTLIVLDSNGAKSTYVEKPLTNGGSCKSTGCGCGA